MRDVCGADQQLVGEQTGVVDEQSDIGAAPGCCADLRLVGDIQSHGDASTRELALEVRGIGRIARGGIHLGCAGFGEQHPHERLTDAPVGACHQRDAITDLHGFHLGVQEGRTIRGSG